MANGLSLSGIHLELVRNDSYGHEKMRMRISSSLLIVQLTLLGRSLVDADDATPRLSPRSTAPAPIVVAASQDW